MCKIPDPTEAQNDKKYRIYLYGWCKEHNCTKDECEEIHEERRIIYGIERNYPKNV